GAAQQGRYLPGLPAARLAVRPATTAALRVTTLVQGTQSVFYASRAIETVAPIQVRLRGQASRATSHSHRRRRCAITLVVERARLHDAVRTHVDLADDLVPASARIVDPLALAAIIPGLEVHLGTRRIVDQASLYDELVEANTRSGYGVTDLTTIHSHYGQRLSRRRAAGIPRGSKTNSTSTMMSSMSL